MYYSLEEIQQICGGSLVGKQVSTKLDFIYFDTRKIGIAGNSLFICLKGPKRDGHDFIAEAYRKGIRHFIVENIASIPEQSASSPEDELATALKVESTLSCLQELAKHHRSKFEIPIIGITGSNGKTIVKEWLYTLLSEKYTVLRSPMSFNSQIGVALSILHIDESHEIAIIEAAVAEQGDMKSLAVIIKPSHGIFTNIGDAHQSGFSDKQTKIKEKSLLFDGVQHGVYSVDHEGINQELDQKSFIHHNWSLKEESAQHTVKIDSHARGTNIQLNNENLFSCSFTETHSIENLIHCIVTSIGLGLSTEEIQQGISKLNKQSHRLQLLSGNNQSIIIDDSYSFDLISLQTALNTLQNHAAGRLKLLIISDIPNQSTTAYNSVATLCKLFDIDQLFHVGKDEKKIKDALDEDARMLTSFEDTEDLLAYLRAVQLNQAIILVKGARVFKFESVVTLLTRQTHDCTLEVHLGALRQNLNVLSRKLKPTTKTLSIIKANAYGTGSAIIGGFLESTGVDYLGVAYTDEGIELRKSGVQLPILVLNPEAHLFEQLIQHELEPEIYSLDQLKQLVLLGERATLLKVHLKIDTGMNRLGFQESELDELIKIIKQANVTVTGIMSHFAASDDAEKDSFSKLQIERFESMSHHIMNALSIEPIRHFLNSSGVIRFPEQQYDMVRIGKGMYGIDMTGQLDDQLERVHRLFASIAQIKEVPAGSTIGYGCQLIVDRPHRIAIINIGYADGLIRAIGNGKINFMVNNQFVPTIGNICMDMCMLDITNASDIHIGDRVEIFGNTVDIRTVAKAAQTIPLEILSKLSGRLKKVYIED